jgi:TolB-like protein
MAGSRSSPSIATVCIVGNRQLGPFGRLKPLLRAIRTSWIAAFVFIVPAGAWDGLGGNAAASQSLLGTPRFSVVVLPFANLSGDPMQEPIADAISNKLTSALTRLRGSLVVEPSTAAAYKDRPVDAKAIREELRVRYVLKGSVQTANDDTKISAELIDAEIGARLWDDQFDVPRAGSFDMQDKIAARLTRGIYLKLPEIQTAQRAIELDPSLADAYWHMGFLLRRTCKYQMSLASIDEAIWLSPRDSFRSVCYADKAGSHIALKQYDQAIESARRAIAINPNKGSQHFYLVVALALTGETSRAHEALQGYLVIVGPNRTMADWKVTRARTVNEQTNPCYVEYWNALFEGLRKAGVPEE